MAGKMVEFDSNGGKAQGYLATPPGGKGPGLIVIQEWWGLIAQIKGVCDMLAGAGFTALAPDLYHGKSAQIGEPDEAGKLMMSTVQNLEQVAKDVRGAAAYLAVNEANSTSKVGVIGFCLGGMLALYAATVSDEIDAVVDCYGVPPPQRPDYANIKGPVLGIFGGKDHYSQEAMPPLERELRLEGVPFEKHVYPNADHAFLNEQRADVYRADDAKDAWGKILPFLKKHLS